MSDRKTFVKKAGLITMTRSIQFPDFLVQNQKEKYIQHQNITILANKGKVITL